MDGAEAAAEDVGASDDVAPSNESGVAAGAEDSSDTADVTGVADGSACDPDVLDDEVTLEYSDGSVLAADAICSNDRSGIVEGAGAEDASGDDDGSVDADGFAR